MGKNIIQEVNLLPVMAAHCKTCPFKPDNDGRWQNVPLANEVTERTLFKAQQVCHGTEDKNRKPRNRCLGSFEHNANIYAAFGLDKEAFRAGEINLKTKKDGK